MRNKFCLFLCGLFVAGANSRAAVETLFHPTCKIFLRQADGATNFAAQALQSAFALKGYKIVKVVSEDEALLRGMGNPNLIYFNYWAFESDVTAHKCVLEFELQKQWRDGIGIQTKRLFAVHMDTERVTPPAGGVDCYAEFSEILFKLPKCEVR